ARRVKASDPAVGGLAGRAVVAQALVVAVRGARAGDRVLAAWPHGLAVEPAGPPGEDLDLGSPGEQDVAGVVDGDAADRVDRVGQEDRVAGAGVDAADRVAGADIEGIGRDGGRLAGGEDAVAGDVRAGLALRSGGLRAGCLGVL